MTRILRIDPEQPDPAAIAEAAARIRLGQLVAFAAETVYGLGADATSAEAVAGIFAAKGRPAFNPLIVHAVDVAMARGCVAGWPGAADRLAGAFWPGPLTLVLPRSGMIPDIVTAGRETVGVRVPATAVALWLIDVAERPIAAPSANRSTGVSPTLAAHVADDLGGAVDLILDSGPTAIGLESTVLDLTTRVPRILRPGPITAQEIGSVLKRRVRHGPEPADRSDQSHASPGQMAVHYAPRTPAVRVEDPATLGAFPWPRRAAVLSFGERLASPPPWVLSYHMASPEGAARNLYRLLRECDAAGLDLIVVVPPPDLPRWRAIRDRLRRATRGPG